MKKSFLALFSAGILLCSGCGLLSPVTDLVGGGGLTKRQEITLTAKYDYGLHQEGRAVMLYDGILPFFDGEEYGVAPILAGDEITVFYKGEFLVLESYPAQAVTKDITIMQVEVNRAPIVEAEVVENADGVELKGKDGARIDGYETAENAVVREDGSYFLFSEADVGKTFYVSLYAERANENGENIVAAIYEYYPRPMVMPCCICGKSDCDGHE